jgi:antitoxin MazE
MHTVIKTRLIKIGNSQGIRIPKLLLEQLSFGNEVELAIEQDQLVIRPSHHPRENWDEQFRAMSENGDDQLLDVTAANLTEWDNEEWEW